MNGFKKLALWAVALVPLATAAPTVTKRDEAPAAKVVEGKYIITLKPGLSTRDLESHMAWVEDVHKRSLGERDGSYTGVEKTIGVDGADFEAYVGTFDDATIEMIKGNPEVAEVEQDQIWTLSWIQEETVSENPQVMAKRALTTQSGATWGLSAISHQSASTSSGYIYDTSAGSGTYAYVVDSGIQTSHNEFGGRYETGYNVLDVAFQDTLGHGTHVAGTIAGSTYGVSKQATVVPVKVFDGNEGYTSDILEGLTWAINDISSKGRASKAVINMSLGGSYSSSMNSAVQSGYSQGVLSVVAAGNSAANAAYYSPASAPNAVTVGAIDSSLSEAYYSNYGSTLDLYAPGSSVKSAWIGSNSATNTISGTSMASPHVAGLVLYYQSVYGSGSASSVTSAVLANTNNNKLSGLSSGSPNKLGYNGNGN